MKMHPSVRACMPFLESELGLAMSVHVCSEELSGSSSMIRIKPSGY